MKKTITPADILSYTDYEEARPQKRAAMIERKKKRRMMVGPYATFTFENYDTMWMQVQEMLRIEKGGEDQLTDELRAYNPLIPNGKELVATVMFEIEDAARRAKILASLGGVENSMGFRIGGETNSEIIKGRAENDLAYTSEEGKASSVQFVHFLFNDEQIGKFRDGKTECAITISHPQYGHSAAVPPDVRAELAGDFD